MMSRWVLVALAVVVCTAAYAQKIRVPMATREWKTLYPTFPSAGEPELTGSRIVGGKPAVRGSRPYQAAVFIDNMFFCGGILVSDQWLLTAGHCAYKAKHMDIFLGAYNITAAVEEGRQSTTSTEFHLHPNFNLTTITNDLALVKISEKVQITDTVKTITLPAADYNNTVGMNLTVSGWGKTSDESYISPIMMEVTIPVISQEDCKVVYGELIYDGDFCTSSKGGHGPCNGDSGGPLTYSTSADASEDVVLGIVSFGSNSGCTAGYPDAFTDVPYFVDWIKKVIGSS